MKLTARSAAVLVVIVMTTAIVTRTNAMGVTTTTSAAQSQAAENCTYHQEGPFAFDISGYPGPGEEVEIEVNDVTVVELLYAPSWSTSKQHYLIPIRSAESGNRRFILENYRQEFKSYSLHKFNACSYGHIMRFMSLWMAPGTLPVSWTVPFNGNRVITPVEPGNPWPGKVDPLFACNPNNWENAKTGDWISSTNSGLYWEVEANSVSAFGEYPGTIVVTGDKIRIRSYSGECEASRGRWWEYFSFKRLLQWARNASNASDVEFNPYLFVRDGRVFLPIVRQSGQPDPAPYPGPRP